MARQYPLGCPFYPKTYVLPQVSDPGLLQHPPVAAPGLDSFFPLSSQDRPMLEALSREQPTSLWIAKPHNGYGGRGVVAMKASDAGFGQTIEKGSTPEEDKKKSGVVVQEYIANPMLVGGYKFHIRIYLVISKLHPTPEAYVHQAGHVMFATQAFNTLPSSLGKNFKPKVHLSNYDINVTLANQKALLADKPGVGRGALWGLPRLYDYASKASNGKITQEGLWGQIMTICNAVVTGIASHPTTKGHNLPEGRHFQWYGLDLMPDESGKMWLLEANDTPGLSSCDPYLSTSGHDAAEVENPDSVERDAITRQVVHDTIALAGMDSIVREDPNGDLTRFWRCN